MKSDQIIVVLILVGSTLLGGCRMTRYVSLDGGADHRPRTYSIPEANRYLDGKRVVIESRLTDPGHGSWIREAELVHIDLDSTTWFDIETQQLAGAANGEVSTITFTDTRAISEGALVGSVVGALGLVYADEMDRRNHPDKFRWLPASFTQPIAAAVGALVGLLVGGAVGSFIKGGPTVLVYPDEASARQGGGFFGLFRRHPRRE
jgi:hypothetical protein